MPGLFYQPTSRRKFLTGASKALAAAGLAGAVGRWPDGARADDAAALRVGLLSDTHIAANLKDGFRKFVPWDNLQTVLPQVTATNPDWIILNGDAARLTGETADYEALRRALAPVAERTPIYLGLGNHDHRERFLQVFPQTAVARQNVVTKFVFMVERPWIRFLILDSLFVTNQTAGLLGKAQRTWLAEYLKTSDARNTVIFVHHTLGDGDGELLDAERFFEVIRPHKKVKAVFYGHSHVYSFSQRNGAHLINLPAVGYNFADGEPVGWVDAKFSATGVTLQLRALGGNRVDDGKVTTLEWLS